MHQYNIRYMLATRLPGYTSCGTCMTSIVAENRTIGRLLSIVDQRILRGSRRRSMASSVVVARVLAVSRRQLPLQLMFSLRRLLPRSHPSVMPLPLYPSMIDFIVDRSVAGPSKFVPTHMDKQLGKKRSLYSILRPTPKSQNRYW